MPESKTILLVEDEALIALHEKRILEQAGYRVEHVRTGEMAVSIVCSQDTPPIDLILMDIDLGPGIDGTQAAQQILARRDVPIIFISMHTEQEWVDRTEQITSYGYIVKGSGATVVLASIKMAFKLHEAHVRLQESEDRYRMLVENSTNSIGIHCEGKVVYANPAALKLFHAGRLEDVIGMPVFALVHPDYRAAAIARVKATYEKQAFASTIEEKFITLDGKEIDVEVTGIPIDYHGKPATQLIIRDITRRKQIEQELHAREQEYKTLVENTPDVLVRFDRQYRHIFVNPAVEKEWGISPARLLGKSHRELGYPPDKAAWSEGIIRQVFESGQEVVFEVATISAADHKYYLSRGVPEFTEDGSVSSVLIIHRNITERKQVEDALRQSEARVQAMFQAIPDLIFRLDRAGVFLGYKADTSDLYAQVAGTIVGQGIHELMPPEFSAMVDEKIHATLASRSLQTFEYQLPIPERGIRQYEARMTVSGSDEVTAIVRDITERKQAEDQIKMLLSEKDLLLKEVHHRIKNNMSTIISLLTLHASSQEDPASRLVLQDATSRVQSMMVLYDKLYQAENFNLVSLRDYVPALLTEVISLFPLHETVTTEVHIEDITLSPQQVSPLGIILTELITNAMKYAFPNQRQGRITVLTTQQAGQVTITFSDDGVGLPDTFDIKRSPRFGMYLVAMLVSQLRGTITAERQAGTRFVIRFPA